MISDRIYKLVKLVFDPFLDYFCVFQYTWNSETKLFVKRFFESKELKLYHFSKILLAIWISFSFAQLLRFYLVGDINQFVFTLTISIALLLVAICCYLCTHLEDSYFLTINNALVLLRHLHSKSNKCNFSRLKAM